jgi:glycosyltransferase involved in cell wall biosynthesis
MKILFVQHAVSIGGSALSLKVVLEDGLQAGWTPYLIVQNEDMKAYYADVLPSSQIFLLSRMPTFDHHSAHVFGASPREIARVLYRVVMLLRITPELRRIVSEVQPVTIHLNSSVLIPYLPCLAGHAQRLGVHVRERVAGGWRNRLFCRLMARYADYGVFISPVERQLLPANVRQAAVIYNYVKLPTSLMGHATSERVQAKKLTLLSLGGVSQIKGIDALLALAKALPEDITVRIVGATLGSIGQVVPPNVQILPATPHPLEEIARCDFLVFWTRQPHFPRPVYEAWLLKKPCIVSQCMQSQDDVDPSSVILSPGDEASDLIATVQQLVASRPDLSKLVERAFNIAQEKFGPGNFSKLKSIIEVRQRKEAADHAAN